MCSNIIFGGSSFSFFLKLLQEFLLNEMQIKALI